jgi:aminopeptidase N
MSNADGPESAGPERENRTFGRPPAFVAPPPSVAPPPRLRRHRVLPSTVLIVVAVVIMVVALAVIPYLTPRLNLRSGSGSPGPVAPSAPTDPGGRDRGGSGVDDPYYPDYGSSGYDARHYTISLNWAPSAKTLGGTTVITAEADHRLRSFYVDLVLPVTRVSVDGRPARFSRESFYDVRITPARAVTAGTIFRVEISYAGRPADYRLGSSSPWWVTGDEVTAASEPEGSAWWYPANDHPSDPATLDVSVRVPAGLEAVSNGRLVSRDSRDEPGFDTWHWVTEQTLDTYQSLLSIGRYELRQGTADGRPYVYAVSSALPRQTRDKAFANLAATPRIVADLEQYWGRYPYDEIGGIVTAHRLWYAGLETATRPLYEVRAATEGDAAALLTHELAHMWFGGRVTLLQWNDIFLSEGYASFSEWLRTERTGGRTAEDRLRSSYDRLAGNQDFWRITMIDPGRDHLFDAVYTRGPMTLQALRNVIGEDAFFRFSRSWAAGSGPHSLEQWMVTAQRFSRVDLEPFFEAWIYADHAPARTAANGLA